MRQILKVIDKLIQFLIQSQTKKVKRQRSTDVKTANRRWVLINWDMFARIPTYHFQSYKLQLPTVITRDLPLDGLQKVKLPMGFQFQRWTIKHSKNKNESWIKSLVSAVFNHLKCNSSNIWFLWFVFPFRVRKAYWEFKMF